MINMYQLGEVVVEKANVAIGYINRCIAVKNKGVIVLLLSVLVREYQNLIFW